MKGTDAINIKDITSKPYDITGGYLLEYSHGENPKNLSTVNMTRCRTAATRCALW